MPGSQAGVARQPQTTHDQGVAGRGIFTAAHILAGGRGPIRAISESLHELNS